MDFLSWKSVHTGILRDYRRIAEVDHAYKQVVGWMRGERLGVRPSLGVTDGTQI